MNEPEESIRMWEIPDSPDRRKMNDEFVEWVGTSAPPSFDDHQVQRFNEVRDKSQLSLICYNRESEVWATDEFWGRRDLIILGSSSIQPGDQLIPKNGTALAIQIVAAVLPFDTNVESIVRAAQCLNAAKWKSVFYTEEMLCWSEDRVVVLVVEKAKLPTYGEWQIELNGRNSGIQLVDVEFNKTINVSDCCRHSRGQFCWEFEAADTPLPGKEIADCVDIVFEGKQYKLREWIWFLEAAASLAKASSGTVEFADPLEVFEQVEYLSKLGDVELKWPIEDWNCPSWRNPDSYVSREVADANRARPI